eukprot:g17125.t1
MGTAPKLIEARGIELLEAVVADSFAIQYGHEVRADAFLRLKQKVVGPQSQRGWLPIQIKVTSKRTQDWGRKMKHLLHKQCEALHNVIVIGISLHPSDSWFIHQVRRHSPCRVFAVTDAAWNFEQGLVTERLRELWGCPSNTLYDEPARAFAYSQETLLEVDARAAFVEALRGSDVEYRVCRDEFSGVDGYLCLRSAPDLKYTVQEKALSWRMEGETALGLRTKLRRANGKNYKATDGEFFLLHARSGKPGTCEPFSLFGSALLPFSELSARGMLDPGASILAMYPTGPGVKNPRDGWAEKYFKPINEVPQFIENELRARNGGSKRDDSTETDSLCAIQ